MITTSKELEQGDRPVPTVEYALIRAHGWAAIITLFVSALFGTLVALKFNFPDLLGGQAWSTWGRLRYNHTQGIFFGWLGNAFLLFLYFAVPRLADRPVLSRKLGWWLFGLWNFAVVLPGWVLVACGFSQPLEWAEFPLIVDLFVVIAFGMIVAQFVIPFLRSNLGELYVSGWYIIGGLVFTLLAYPIGNIVPELIPGARGAAFSGLWIHDAVGLFVTPLAVAIAYFVIPAVTQRPIYSHFLSMVGFWLLFFIYPLNGMHHYVFSAIPMSAQKSAIVASAYLGMDVILVVTNLLLSLRCSSGTVGRDLPLRFVWTGVIFYLIVSLQGSMQAMMPINRLMHFSDWVIGHSHLAMFGFASFVAIGGMAHVWQRIPGVRYNERAMAWSFWMLSIGLGLMVLDLTAAGVIEGQMWNGSTPWLDSVRAVRGYWLTRTIAALPSLAGFLLFWAGIATGKRMTGVSPANVMETKQQPLAVPLVTAQVSRGPGMFKLAFVVAFVAGVGFFALSFLVLGVIPGNALAKQIEATAPVNMPLLSASENRGRFIYGREGCAYCHTQQVRFLERDVNRWGPPTEAWETKYDYPQLWGTRRVGPDLAREAGVRSPDWQLTHLYNPRLVIRDSVMPGYPWLFRHAADVPTGEGQDLLAYVQSLGRARQISGYDTRPVMTSMADASEMSGMFPHIGSIVQNANAPRQNQSHATWRPSSDASEFDRDREHGAEVFAANCASCHGDKGKGDGAAARTLLPRPFNLTAVHSTPERLSEVLSNGVQRASMPAWRDLPERDLRSLITFVTSIETPVQGSAPSDDTQVVQKLFSENCASCHGAEGAGDGVAAQALAPRPTNFRREQPSEQYAWKVLENGVAGTAMPNWKTKLTDEERHKLVAYVRSLYSIRNSEAEQ